MPEEASLQSEEYYQRDLTRQINRAMLKGGSLEALLFCVDVLEIQLKTFALNKQRVEFIQSLMQPIAELVVKKISPGLEIARKYIPQEKPNAPLETRALGASSSSQASAPAQHASYRLKELLELDPHTFPTKKVVAYYTREAKLILDSPRTYTPDSVEKVRKEMATKTRIQESLPEIVAILKQTGLSIVELKKRIKHKLVRPAPGKRMGGWGVIYDGTPEQLLQDVVNYKPRGLGGAIVERTKDKNPDRLDVPSNEQQYALLGKVIADLNEREVTPSITEISRQLDEAEKIYTSTHPSSHHDIISASRALTFTPGQIRGLLTPENLKRMNDSQIRNVRAYFMYARKLVAEKS